MATHVSGSIAGRSLETNTEYNGMAPQAKIFFTDLADATQILTLPRGAEGRPIASIPGTWRRVGARPATLWPR